MCDVGAITEVIAVYLEGHLMLKVTSYQKQMAENISKKEEAAALLILKEIKKLLAACIYLTQ